MYILAEWKLAFFCLPTLHSLKGKDDDIGPSTCWWFFVWVIAENRSRKEMNLISRPSVIRSDHRHRAHEARKKVVGYRISSIPIHIYRLPNPNLYAADQSHTCQSHDVDTATLAMRTPYLLRLTFCLFIRGGPNLVPTSWSRMRGIIKRELIINRDLRFKVDSIGRWTSA